MTGYFAAVNCFLFARFGVCGSYKPAAQRSASAQAATLPGHTHLAGLARLAERDHPRNADFLHRFAGRLEIVARVEFVRSRGEHFANGRSNGNATVGIDVDLSHAVLDATLN